MHEMVAVNQVEPKAEILGPQTDKSILHFILFV